MKGSIKILDRMISRLKGSMCIQKHTYGKVLDESKKEIRALEYAKQCIRENKQFHKRIDSLVRINNAIENG